MKLKRIISTLIILTILTLSLAACGSTINSKTNSKTTIKLGVVGSVYDDLWKPAKEILANEGIELEIVQFSDYVTPNNALANGEIDLNAFQHYIYLEGEVSSYGYGIQAIGNTFISPLSIYSSKISSVSELKEGDTIAIPNDVTNGGRAIKVLEAAGIVELKEGTGFDSTVNDIEKYNVDIKIVELKANTIPSSLQDVTAGIINGNYALDFGLKADEAIYEDTDLDEESYWNVIAARTSDLKDAEKVALYKKVVDAYQSTETEKVYNETFGGFYIKAGWDQDLLADK